MDWVSPDFCDRVYHLLFTSSIRELQHTSSSPLWSDCAKYHLGKRRNYSTITCNVLSEIKENPYARFTELILYCGSEEHGLKALPYFTTDDDSLLDLLDGLEDRAHLKILHKVDFIGCFFTKIKRLPYLSPLSLQFLRKHIEKGVLQDVSLAKGWRKEDAEIIEGLFVQTQLVEFVCMDSQDLKFESHSIENLFRVLLASQSYKKRYINFATNCTANDIRRAVEMAGFTEREPFIFCRCIYDFAPTISYLVLKIQSVGTQWSIYEK